MSLRPRRTLLIIVLAPLALCLPLAAVSAVVNLTLPAGSQDVEHLAAVEKAHAEGATLITARGQAGGRPRDPKR